MKPKPYLQMRKDLPGRGELRQLCRLLGLSRVAVLGALYLVWRWADDQLGADSDRVQWTTAEDLDKEAETPGFAAALVSVGWLQTGPDWVEFPGYNQGPGSAARWEADKAKRTQNARDKANGKNRGAALAQFGEELLAGAADLLVGSVTGAVTESVTGAVTGSATAGNKNKNKNIRNPLVPLPGEENPKFSQDETKPGQTGREARRAARFEALLNAGKESGLKPAVFEAWGAFLCHCRDLGRLPSENSARALSGDLAQLADPLAAGLLRGWIRAGRWTPGEDLAKALGAAGRGSLAALQNRPPIPQGGRKPWEDEKGRGWVSRDSVGLLWWDAGKRVWVRVREGVKV